MVSKGFIVALGAISVVSATKCSSIIGCHADNCLRGELGI